MVIQPLTAPIAVVLNTLSVHYTLHFSAICCCLNVKRSQQLVFLGFITPLSISVAAKSFIKCKQSTTSSFSSSQQTSHNKPLFCLKINKDSTNFILCMHICMHVNLIPAEGLQRFSPATLAYCQYKRQRYQLHALYSHP